MGHVVVSGRKTRYYPVISPLGGLAVGHAAYTLEMTGLTDLLFSHRFRILAVAANRNIMNTRENFIRN